MEDKITIECIACKRTQILRKSKLSVCEYYTCSLGSCKINPDFEFPKPNDGYITVIEFHAAGAFSGVKHKLPDEEEKKSLERAKQLAYLGMMQVKEKSQKPHLN